MLQIGKVPLPPFLVYVIAPSPPFPSRDQKRKPLSLWTRRGCPTYSSTYAHVQCGSSAKSHSGVVMGERKGRSIRDVTGPRHGAGYSRTLGAPFIDFVAASISSHRPSLRECNQKHCIDQTGRLEEHWPLLAMQKTTLAVIGCKLVDVNYQARVSTYDFVKGFARSHSASWAGSLLSDHISKSSQQFKPQLWLRKTSSVDWS